MALMTTGVRFDAHSIIKLILQVVSIPLFNYAVY